ncbi:nuclear transport factor 2 family protein [Chitinimonas sp.]|uniref:nuclear transport factor 2 family protein n=1 Tax=Chitinimonas sp. TaxID=1934313 RepID=UPI002F93CE47
MNDMHTHFSASHRAVLDWYQSLNPDRLQLLPLFYHPEACFKDPFNEVQGHAAITRIFAHMFETTQQPRFVVLEQVTQGAQLFVTWDFHFGLRGKDYTIHGCSRMLFDAEGKITLHRDYWDPAEELWQKLPLLGGVIAWLRRRFQAR